MEGGGAVPAWHTSTPTTPPAATTDAADGAVEPADPLKRWILQHKQEAARPAKRSRKHSPQQHNHNNNHNNHHHHQQDTSHVSHPRGGLSVTALLDDTPATPPRAPSPPVVQNHTMHPPPLHMPPATPSPILDTAEAEYHTMYISLLQLRQQIYHDHLATVHSIENLKWMQLSMPNDQQEREIAGLHGLYQHQVQLLTTIDATLAQEHLTANQLSIVDRKYRLHLAFEELKKTHENWQLHQLNQHRLAEATLQKQQQQQQQQQQHQEHEVKKTAVQPHIIQHTAQNIAEKKHRTNKKVNKDKEWVQLGTSIVLNILRQQQERKDELRKQQQASEEMSQRMASDHSKDNKEKRKKKAKKEKKEIKETASSVDTTTTPPEQTPANGQ